jgi:hypothetical protein
VENLRGDLGGQHEFEGLLTLGFDVLERLDCALALFMTAFDEYAPAPSRSAPSITPRSVIVPGRLM